MGRRDEIKAQIDKLTKEYNAADDDDDLELDVERDGIKARVRGRHARAILKRLGVDDDDQGDGAGDGKGEGQGDDEGQGDAKGKGKDKAPATDKDPRSGHRYFS